MTLTVSAIAAAKPGDTIRDDDVHGLHLRAFANRKSFYLYYRTRAGEERRPKLGDYGVFTINDARRLARSLLLEVAAGKDPAGKWKADRAGATVNELIDDYETNVVPKRKSARSIKSCLKHIRAALGTRKMASLTLDDGQKLHADLSRRAPTQANRVMVQLSILLTRAERVGARPLNSNFCGLIEKNAEVKRRRYLQPGDEAKAVGAALRARLYGPQHEAALFVFLLLLTGARKSELGNAKVADRVGNALVIRAADHKTGAHVGDKLVHLPAAAIELLDDPLRPVHSRKGYLLGVSDPRALWAAVRDEAGCPDLRIHDLRHTFASFGLGGGLNLSMIGGLLSHTSPATTQRYAHLITGPAQQAVNLIADGVTAALAAPVEEEAQEAAE